MVLHNYFPSSLLHISSQQLSLIRKRYCLIGISATHSWSQAKEDITRKAKGNPRCNPPEKGGLNMIKLLYKCLIVPVQREVHAIAMIYIDLCLGDRGMTYQWLLRSWGVLRRGQLETHWTPHHTDQWSPGLGKEALCIRQGASTLWLIALPQHHWEKQTIPNKSQTSPQQLGIPTLDPSSCCPKGIIQHFLQIVPVTLEHSSMAAGIQAPENCQILLLMEEARHRIHRTTWPFRADLSHPGVCRVGTNPNDHKQYKWHRCASQHACFTYFRWTIMCFD